MATQRSASDHWGSQEACDLQRGVDLGKLRETLGEADYASGPPVTIFRFGKAPESA